MQTYRQQRNEIIRDLVKIIKPHLWSCGYVDKTETNGLLKIATFAQKTKAELWPGRKLRGGFVLGEYFGFSKDGVITDDGTLVGCITLTPFADLPIEDLYKLRHTLRTKPPTWHC